MFTAQHGAEIAVAHRSSDVVFLHEAPSHVRVFVILVTPCEQKGRRVPHSACLMTLSGFNRT